MMWVSKSSNGKRLPSTPKRPHRFRSPLKHVSQWIKGVISMGVKSGA